MSAKRIEPSISLRRSLLAWYRKNARALPWRETSDPYAIWLSEVMLQQTRVDQGLPYYKRFLDAFPTAQRLAAASEDEVLKQWEGLGYYSRARNLHKAAKRVVSEFGGRFPKNSMGLLQLSGIGPYTAAAIASIAFGERVAVLDGNVIRVLSRLYNIEAPIDSQAVRAKLQELAQRLVPRTSSGEFNQAMMELGATVCVPRQPRCDKCPVRRSCKATKLGVQEQRPVKNAKARTPHHDVVIAVIRRKDTYLVGRRPESGLLGGLWDFPQARLGSRETHAHAIKRAAEEQIGASVNVGKSIAVVKHAYSHFRVTASVYGCSLKSAKPRPICFSQLRWTTLDELRNLALPKLAHKFLDSL